MIGGDIRGKEACKEAGEEGSSKKGSGEEKGQEVAV